MNRQTLLKKLQKLENTAQLLHSLVEEKEKTSLAARMQTLAARMQNKIDKFAEPFRRGWDAVQQGGALGPDALSRYVSNLGKPDKNFQNNRKTNVGTGSKLKGNLSATELANMLNIENKQAFVRAMQSLKSGKPIAANDILSNKALAEAFVRLMQMSPADTQKIMQKLQRVRAEESVSRPNNSINENKIKGNINALKIAQILGIEDVHIFRRAVQLIIQGQPIQQREQYAVLAQAFVLLLKKDPAETRKIMQLLQRVELEQPATESANTKNFNSLKEELYFKLISTNR